jgi:general secretion pathway protein K
MRGDRPVRTAGSSDRGIALILVLWVVVLMSMAALSLSLLTRAEALATLSFKEELEYKFLAEAGIQRGVMELLFRQANRDQRSILEGSEPYQCDGRAYEAEISGGHYRMKIMEESGKINLNTLTDESGIVLKNLLTGNGVAEDRAAIIVDSILDWKDEDNLHRLSGAEDGYYQSLPKPYKAKNADFDSPEELAFVRGVTSAILYGSGEQKGILPFCTIFSKGDKINLNTAPREVLKAIPGMTDAMIQRIMAYRDLGPAEKAQETAGWTDAEFSVIAPYVTTAESNVFTIDATGYRDSDKRHYSVRATVVIEGAQKYRIIYFQSPSAAGS